MSTSPASAIQSLLQGVGNHCVGHNPFEITALMHGAYQHLFAARGNCSAPRFGAQLLAGLDMALWDITGKATGRAVHELLGGAVRDHVQYFGFPQGESAQEVAREARELAANGCEVIYVKVGRGEALDLAIAEHVRTAIGSKRLRLDANEAWDVLTALRMIRKLAAFDIEFIEQPTRSDSLAALAQVKAASPIAIAADQLVFTPEDVYDVCRHQAADVIVLGRGSTGRGQEFARHVVGDMGGADTFDYLSGLDHLVEQGIADPKRLGVTGISHGGFMTSWLITQDSSFAAAVPVAPMTNHVSHRLISNIPHFDELFLADKYNNLTGRYFERSPIMHAHKVKTPTLNICGKLDRCTPPEETMQFHNALLENGVKSVLVTYPEEGHGVRKFPTAIDYAARMVAWFQEHLPVTAAY